VSRQVKDGFWFEIKFALDALGVWFFWKIFKITNVEIIYFLKLCFDGLENLRQKLKKVW
jgi:hypothetical protein